MIELSEFGKQVKAAEPYAWQMRLALLDADRLYSSYALQENGGMEVGAWINLVRELIAKTEPQA